jgi:hypothetical protein
MGGLAMATEYPSDDKQDCFEEGLQKCLNEPSPHDEDRFDEEHADDMLSLLEENARLRGLVVRLTDMILKNVADRG